MTRLERRIAAASVFLCITGPAPIAPDPPKPPARCTVLEAWIAHENSVARDRRNHALPY